MTRFDTILQDLQEKVARKQKLSTMLDELRPVQRRLETRVRELDAIRIKEQSDVDKLEGGSLAAFFYNVIGKMDQQLDKEREEAYAAAVRYDTALRELEAVEYDIRRYQEELRGLSGVEAAYLTALKEKKEAIKATGSAAAQEIDRLEEQLRGYKVMGKELREAISAGTQARSAAQQICDRLDDADGYATWDKWGGGLIADIAKHDALDQAQNGVNNLQTALRRFRTEMADVRMQADLQVNLEGFERFADFFFDGWIVDWMVADRIHQSQRQMSDVLLKIDSALSRLSAMERENRGQVSQLQHQIDELVKTSAV